MGFVYCFYIENFTENQFNVKLSLEMVDFVLGILSESNSVQVILNLFVYGRYEFSWILSSVFVWNSSIVLLTNFAETLLLFFKYFLPSIYLSFWTALIHYCWYNYVYVCMQALQYIYLLVYIPCLQQIKIFLSLKKWNFFFENSPELVYTLRFYVTNVDMT